MLEKKHILPLFSRAERFIIALLLVVAVPITSIWLSERIFAQPTFTQPAKGGTLTIAEMGVTDIFNPLYCTTAMTTRTVCSLIFSGLTKIDPFTREIKPDLASTIETSSDLKVYTVQLRQAYFHDGHQVTSEDVLFTYDRLLKDPSYDGPFKGAFNGIKIEAKDPKTVTFTLADNNTFFPNTLTIGIIPKHIIGDITGTDDLLSHPYNHNPIGTGMYQFTSLSKGTNSTEISFRSFTQYYSTKPLIESIHITGYRELTDLSKNADHYDIVYNHDQVFDLPEKEYSHEQFILPQFIGTFFNTNTAPLKDKNIRLALKVGTDRAKITAKIANSQLIDSPFPDILPQKITYNLDKAKSLLNTAKITPEKPITIKMVYQNDENLTLLAQELRDQWAPLGINVTIIPVDFATLQNEFLRTRSYDVLLIGERVGGNVDLYPYFHSSQLEYPGLNFPLYKNVAVDNLLDKIRLTKSDNEQVKLLNQAYEKILADMPMIPMYTPTYHVYINKRVKDSFLPAFPSSPEQIFALISSWYIAEKQIWI